MSPIPARLLALLLLAPAMLPSAWAQRDVRVTGLPVLAMTGRVAGWHWVDGSGEQGGPALQSAEAAGTGDVSWLELQVRGPDRLYFRCLTDYAPVPRSVEAIYINSNWWQTNQSFGTLRYGTTNATLIGTDNLVLMGRPETLVPPPILTFTDPVPALRLWLGRQELTLPAANTANASVECLGSDYSWPEYRVTIPRGWHRLRWEFSSAQGPGLARSVRLDGVRRESGAAVAITSPRRAAWCAGQPCRAVVQTNRARGVAFTAQDLPEGLSLNAASGALTGTVADAGIYYPLITAREVRGSSHTITLRLDVQCPPGPALDEAGLTWTQGRDDAAATLPCALETTQTLDGMDALRIASGAWLETEVSGPDKLSFALPADANRGSLELTVDGRATELPTAVPGPAGWSRYTLDIPAGKHRLRWRCVESVSSGWEIPWYNGMTVYLISSFTVSDNYYWPSYGWSGMLMDDVRLESRPRPVLERPGRLLAAAGSDFTHRLVVSGAAAVTASGLPAGLALRVAGDGQSLELAGTPELPGRYPVLLTARGTTGVTEVTVMLQVLPDIAAAVDSAGLTWRTGGSGGIAWQAVNAAPDESYRQPWDGEDALWVQAFSATDANSAAWIETTVTGPDTLHFRWRGGEYYTVSDLRLLLDGNTAATVTTSAWQAVSVPIPPGTHTLRWAAGASSIGSALDQVHLASDARAYLLLEGNDITCTALRRFTRALQFSRTPDSLAVSGDLPPGLTLSPGGVLSGAATRSGRYEITVTARTAGGEVSRRLTIQVASPCLPDWLASRGLTGSNLNADTDGDGLTLYMEFVLGGDPSRPDRGFAPKLRISENRVSWEFPRGDYDTATARVLMEMSHDLRFWAPLPCYAATDESGQPVHRGSFYSYPLPDSLYFRVRATVPRID